MINLEKIRRRDKRIYAYYLAHPKVSYAAIGRMYKLTRERVRQIMLREKLRKKDAINKI